ncbi:terminase small subunit [Burkholderia seminalis]|uniref:terminase small subunit n=1 Tax=Burkholderia seminalis TaxID=488731 RepID=UPI0014537061|nr:terminase small subunit [Burkholderia seminalis]MCA8429354.1 terminase small subunit [Burkholderia seminalis]VWC10318.1 hypothetical protein BSE24067_05319 [Burkholderia seminalis]
MDEKPLTQKQEAFCYAYLETGNASEAYRRSYDAEQMKPATVNSKALIVLRNPRVEARLQELRRPAIEKAQFTLESHLEKLAELRDAAEKKGNIPAAVAAEIARGKAAGITKDKPELTLEAIVFAMMGGAPRPPTALEPEELQ